MRKLSKKYSKKAFFSKIIIWGLFLLLGACDAITPKPTVIGLLTNGNQKKWYVDKILLNGISQNQECERDDVYTFEFVKPSDSENTRRGGNLKLDPSFLKCNSEDSVHHFTWFLGQNESNLYVEIDGFILLFEIISLENQRFKFRYKEESRYGEKLNIYEYELYSK